MALYAMQLQRYMHQEYNYDKIYSDFTVLDSTQMSLIFPFFHQLLLSMQVGQNHFLFHYKNRTSYKTIIL